MKVIGGSYTGGWDSRGAWVGGEAVEKGLEKGLALMPWPEVAPAESLTGCT